MLKVLNSKCVLRNQSISLTPFIRCTYASKKGSKQNDDNATKDDSPVEPLQLSYNSYEDLSKDSTTPPVLIMHGAFIKSSQIFKRQNSPNLIHDSRFVWFEAKLA